MNDRTDLNEALTAVRDCRRLRIENELLREENKRLRDDIARLRDERALGGWAGR